MHRLGGFPCAWNVPYVTHCSNESDYLVFYLRKLRVDDWEPSNKWENRIHFSYLATKLKVEFWGRGNGNGYIFGNDGLRNLLDHSKFASVCPLARYIWQNKLSLIYLSPRVKRLGKSRSSENLTYPWKTLYYKYQIWIWSILRVLVFKIDDNKQTDIKYVHLIGQT